VVDDTKQTPIRIIRHGTHSQWLVGCSLWLFVVVADAARPLGLLVGCSVWLLVVIRGCRMWLVLVDNMAEMVHSMLEMAFKLLITCSKLNKIMVLFVDPRM